jgi:crossover junction endodeoxyribonuclease RuvC
MKIIGIDPGYDRFGIAVIEKTGGKDILLYSDCVVTDRKKTLGERLNNIANALDSVIKDYNPNLISLEKLFFYSNQKTAGAVAESRGVVLEKAASYKIPVVEFTPSQIKVATTGYGKSDKKQVMFMVSKLVTIDKTIRYDDEYDAIAVAITGLAHQR